MKKAAFGVTVADSVTPLFISLLKKWPSLRYGILAEIGYLGRVQLRKSALSGNPITLSAEKYPYGKDGRRRTVGYYIAKGGKSVRVSAYPLNLYKPEAVYDSVQGAVQQAVESGLRGYDERVLKQRLEDMDAMNKPVKK